MPELLRTDSTHGDFIELVQALDAELAIIDGDDHAFYSQFNKVDALRYVVLAYESERPVGCGAIREYASGTMEVKRMYVLPAGRNKSVATQVLLELERWARELGATKCILETGKRQPDAIALYQKNGYTPIANFGQYIMVGNSVCFAKELD
jgi:putative acetyltransferase